MAQLSPYLSNDAARRVIAWMVAGDSGISSETMASIALDVEKKDSFGLRPPSDPSDFGRCYRLVMAVPEIIDVFPHIARKVPKFKGILDNWDELCALYERDLSKKKSVEMYNRMKELLGETHRAREDRA